MLFNGWKMQTEKEKEKRRIVNAKLDAIRVVALRRKFDHWRDVYASTTEKRGFRRLESNAKQRNVRTCLIVGVNSRNFRTERCTPRR